MKLLQNLIPILLFAVTGLAVAQDKDKLFPEWQVATQSGGSISSQDFAGKPLILHFWATWCPYCKKLQPGLERLSRDYGAQGLQVVAISFNEDPGTRPQDVLESRGHSFITGVEGDKVAAKLGVTGTPTTFFIFADGRVLGMTRNSNPDDPNMEKAVQILLQDKAK